MTKIFLTTICISTLIGLDAFGAPSVRAGGLAVAPSASHKTNTVRAASLSKGSVTKSGLSVSSKPSAETLSLGALSDSGIKSESRLASFQKGLVPKTQSNKADKSTELNAIQSRIDQLEEKQIEKTDVYNKEETDALLSEIRENLLSIDDRGNLSIQSSDGITSIEFEPYYLYTTTGHTPYGTSQTYRLRTPHDFGTSPWTNLAKEYTRGWVADICAPVQNDPDLVACGYWNASGTGTVMSEFKTMSCFKGFHKVGISNDSTTTVDRYLTFENLTQSQIRDQLCGNLSNDACSISEYTENEYGVCTLKTVKLTKSTVAQPELPYYYVTTTNNYGGLLQLDHYNLTVPGSVSSVPSQWVDAICLPHQTDTNLVACSLGGTQYAPGSVMTNFYTTICYSGFQQTGMHNVNQAIQYDYVTFENLTETQIREHFCGTLSNDECSISNYRESSWGAECTEKTFSITILSNYYFTYVGADHGIPALTYLRHYETNAPADSPAIDNFVNGYCGDRGAFWCAKNGVELIPGHGPWLNIKERLHGYVFLRIVDQTNLGTYAEYNTNEDNPASYINNEICGNPNGTDNCYVVEVTDLSIESPEVLDPTSINVDDRYLVLVFKRSIEESQAPRPLR